MSTPLREAILAAIAARLAGTGGATVERTRRTPVSTDNEPMPRLVLTGTDWQADPEREPGRTYYTMGFEVQGYVSTAGPDPLPAEQALHDLHAATVAQLVNWEPSTAGASAIIELGADFTLYDASESARPAGEFTAQFSILAVANSANPYV